ncbi:MAG: sn-glycerol-3-phosphate ABC transporter ATP-binding protein UgpC [Kiritimatiellae bacterium]|nr:sn-glycerol-3-phosphate ABC transporter ATP-binding protein UgpC [Kiritimatiellia bacterium]MDD5520965.1 sn-glycerol-3-phosphate ABC transporter ATP-binding protein UgpC [Kiritimatiellia bacterium]
MAKVGIKNIDKVYAGGIKAVSDFSLEIADGEFVVLVGPSGCGKSTTLRMIAGLEEISAGMISIGDRVVNDVPPKDRDIAMVFQNYALYPHMTVYENMAFGLKLRKFPKEEIDQRIRDAARTLGLDGLLDRRPKALSGGQRQRVAVGRAIVRKPAVFLFDEPLSNLDAKLRVQMRVEISRLHRQLGATMIYVTHDQVEAMTMGQRIVVMKDGVIQQVADPIGLYHSPANRFVAGFIGTPPMNFFAGCIKYRQGVLEFDGNNGIVLPVPDKAKTILQVFNDKPVVLGLRPEDIGSLAAEQAISVPRIKASVEVVEPMGFETYVHMRTGSVSFVCRVGASHGFEVGKPANPAVLMNNASFFDAASEKTIA